MSSKAVNNIKLGVFVLAGLFFLIFLLYMVSKNRTIFGSQFSLKARFENVQGLKPGNNVRYAGIDVGTVKNIAILNDTIIEVVMTIDEKMRSIIRKNAIASIGTDGLVGNKVVNIVAGRHTSDIVDGGDILRTESPVDIGEITQTLHNTNNDISIIAEELKATVQRINSSNALWNLLEDEGLSRSLKSSIENVRLATVKANKMVDDLHSIVDNVKKGKGSAGAILTDTILAYNLNTAIIKFQNVGDSADSLVNQFSPVIDDIQRGINGIQRDLNSGDGPLNLLLKDSEMSDKIRTTMDDIQEAADNLNQSMEALKHNRLFRRYFRKLEEED